MAYAAGAAEQAGHEVRLYDAPAEGLSLDDVIERLKSFDPGLVVVDTSTPSIYSDARTAGEIKSSLPEAFIILVGTHPSALPEESLKIDDRVDAVAVAEYDDTILDLAGALESGHSLQSVEGLLFREKDRLFLTDEREKIKDLDKVPFVSEVYGKHLDVRNYFFAAAGYPMIMIMTGRGCPHRCFFCVYPQVFHGRFYRVRSPENVVDEFQFIVEKFPEVKEIGIEDDCFTANPRRVRRICEQIIERGIRINWYCNVRGDLEYPLMKLMKRAGCRLVTVGFESGCQHILDNISKDERVEKYYRFASDARRAGILVHGCIMTGNPGDTQETLEQSYRFAKKINCDSMQFYPLYVYPGTEAYNWAKGNGYLKTEDFSRWLTEDGLHNCVLSTPSLSSSEMVRLCDKYLKRFHLRPRYLLMKSLQAVKSPSEGYRTFKSARIFFSKLLHGQLDGEHRPS